MCRRERLIVLRVLRRPHRAPLSITGWGVPFAGSARRVRTLDDLVYTRLGPIHERTSGLEDVPAGVGCRPKFGEFHEVAAAGEPLEGLDVILREIRTPKPLDHLARGHLQGVHTKATFDVGPDDVRSEDVVLLDLSALQEVGRLQARERFVGVLVRKAWNDHRPARAVFNGPALDPQPVPEPTEQRQQKDPGQHVDHSKRDAERPPDGTDVAPFVQPDALNRNHVRIRRERSRGPVQRLHPDFETRNLEVPEVERGQGESRTCDGTPALVGRRKNFGS